MKKLTDYSYEVVQNEEVTIEFTPIQVGEHYIAASMDGQTLESQPGPTPTYTFTARKSPGKTHFCKIGCSFPGDTPDTARFESKVMGSEGGNFSGPTIKKTDPFHDPNIEFWVV